MADVVFVVSNNRHHPAMFAPVIARLGEQGVLSRRVVSLCEVRGIPSPARQIEALGVPLERVLPFAIRKGPVNRAVESSKGKPGRHSMLQDVFWRLLLRPRFGRLLAAPPALVVLPNDSSFPYNRLVRLLAAKGIPYLLVQEGIRFPLPGVPNDLAYGRGGAAAIAAWGKSSASYFREIGVEASRIHETGNPRFDLIGERRRDHLLAPAPSRPANLLLLTNPIDEQGFCSKARKLQLVRQFVDELAELLDSGEVRLTLKLHASESRRDYAESLESSPVLQKLAFTDEIDLYPLLEAADGAVIMASTVGLEALLFSLPVGVLELPEAGFVFDYVSGKAAMGLSWSRPMAPQIRELLTYDAPGMVSYLEKHVETRSRATENVTRLVTRLCESGSCRT